MGLLKALQELQPQSRNFLEPAPGSSPLRRQLPEEPEESCRLPGPGPGRTPRTTRESHSSACRAATAEDGSAPEDSASALSPVCVSVCESGCECRSVRARLSICLWNIDCD